VQQNLNNLPKYNLYLKRELIAKSTQIITIFKTDKKMMPVIVPQKEPNLFVSISNFISYKSKKKKKFHR